MDEAMIKQMFNDKLDFISIETVKGRIKWRFWKMRHFQQAHFLYVRQHFN